MAPAMPAMVAPMTLDTHWLTYAELADKLGITGESARNLVRRREWPRKPGNDGAQRVGVPGEYLEDRAKEEPPVAPVEAAVVVPIVSPVDVPVEGTTMAAMEAHIATLKGVVEHERQRADGERERADALVAVVAHLRSDMARQAETTLAADLAKLRSDEAQHVENVERSVADLRSMVEAMRRPADRQVTTTWWQGVASALVGRAS